MAAHDGEDIQAGTFLLDVLQAPLELINKNVYGEQRVCMQLFLFLGAVDDGLVCFGHGS